MTDQPDRDKLSRREFIRQGSTVVAGAAGLAALGAPAILSAQNTASRINFGMIGTGSRGCETLRAISGHEQSIITDICDIYEPNLEEGKKYCGNPNVRTHKDWQKLIAQKDVDALIISTPLYLHVPMSCAGLGAGKHVFSEKSMGLDMKQINQMLEAANAHPDLVYMVGYQSRLNESLAMVKDLVAQGSFGKITQFYCHFDRNQTWRAEGLPPEWDRQLNWRLYKEYCGGLLTEVVTHEVDAILEILGTTPASASFYGNVMVYKDGREHHDSIMGSWEMEDGVIGVATAHLSNASRGSGWKLLGTHGTAESFGGRLKLYWEKQARHLDTVGIQHKFAHIQLGQSLHESEDPNETPAKVVDFEIDNDYTKSTGREFLHFYDCITNGKKPRMDAQSAWNPSVMAFMAYHSSMEHGRRYTRDEVLAMG
ncbi:MAG TPA: Gfo/Idh/MocA family oxidoreductase [Candidatus Glassbacteria bacterium]|nr:Gfo/Idh/MocA family oxidoreductase [Candidatus Glassbacteria bacterium]